MSTVDFGTVDFGTVNLGTVDLGTVDLGTVDFGTVDFGTVNPGTVDFDTASFDAGTSGGRTVESSGRNHGAGFGSRRWSASPVRRPRLRMTGRGRAVLLTIVAIPLVVAALAFGTNAGSAVGTSSSTPLSKVTVVGGETLWALAQQIAPNTDPRDVIADIMSVNQLSSANITPGEQLLIPAQYATHQ